MGVERSVGVGCVGEPAALSLVRDDVDDPADGVGAEPDGHDALVDLDSFGEVHRDVVQIEGRSGSLLGYAVDEDLDVPAGAFRW